MAEKDNPADEEQPGRQDATGEAEDKPATTFDAESINYVYNKMPDSMTIENAHFGVDVAGTATRTRVTGRVSDLEDTLAHFVHPERFDEASAALKKAHAVVLYGPPGRGKRTSALALLKAVAKESLFLLSPQLTLAELRTRTYDKGLGYAIIDHVAAPETDGEFSWRVLTDRLASSGAYLVVTATTDPARAGDAISQLPWSQPDLEQVLRNRMTSGPSEEDLCALRETLANCHRIRDVVELAGRLDKGEPPEDAASHFDLTAENDVTAWFDGKRSRRQIMEVTTLAFSQGASERVVELSLAALERHLEQHMPEPQPEEGAAEEALPQRRHGLVDPEGLIARRTVSTDVGPRGELVFGSPAYHRHVLRALWSRMDVAFWNAVHGWLDEIVTRQPRRVAVGVAALAEVAFDEAFALLQNWSAGSRGGSAQRAAIYTLSMMAMHDQLAPTSLQVATRWVHGRDAARRWSGAMAFSGELGVRFPLEAINKLWELCTQAHTTAGNVTMALAHLFTTLARDTPDAGMVLKVLSKKLERFDRPGGNASFRLVAISAICAVLGARDFLTGRQSVLLHLRRSPDQIRTVARLWATVLANRPTRLRGIESLRDALKDLAEHDQDAATEVQRMGEALAAHMTEGERHQLRDDMRKVTARQDTNDNELIAALFTALLTALGRTGPEKERS